MASNDKKAMDALLGDNLEQRLKPDAPKVKKEQWRENWVNKLPKMTISNDSLQGNSVSLSTQQWVKSPFVSMLKRSFTYPKT